MKDDALRMLLASPPLLTPSIQPQEILALKLEKRKRKEEKEKQHESYVPVPTEDGDPEPGTISKVSRSTERDRGWGTV